MAEFVAVVNEGPRLYRNGTVSAMCSVVLGVRVNGGSTIMDKKPEDLAGKQYERSWTNMPDDLAFATAAFFRRVYKLGLVPGGHYFSCHVYQRFALGLSQQITLPKGIEAKAVDLADLPAPGILRKKYNGYDWCRPGTEADGPGWSTGTVSTHAVVMLPSRRGVPECMAVENPGGKMVVSGIGQFNEVYGDGNLYRVKGLAQ